MNSICSDNENTVNNQMALLCIHLNRLLKGENWGRWAASANASTTKPHAFKIELCGFNPIMVVTRMKSIVCDGRHKKVKQYREKWWF